MGSLYIHALSETAVRPWQDDDGRQIESVAVGDVFAICERRAQAPPLTEAELQRQHSIVQRIADAAPAVLPARFGSLVDERELASIVQQRAGVLKEALALVRDNVQMTLRIAAPAPPQPQRAAPRSGRDHLDRRRAEMFPSVPAGSEKALGATRAFVVDERRRTSDSGIVTVYHLVRRRDVKEYRRAITEAAVPGVAMSGPWAPFAFVPELVG